MGHDALGSSLLTANLQKSSDILQTTFDGAFEQNALADSTKMIPCIDDATADLIVAFIPQVLDKATGSLSDLLKLPDMIKAFAA